MAVVVTEAFNPFDLGPGPVVGLRPLPTPLRNYEARCAWCGFSTRPPYRHDVCGVREAQAVAAIDQDPAVVEALRQVEAARELLEAAQAAADRARETKLRALDLPDWFIERQIAARKDHWGDGDY